MNNIDRKIFNKSFIFSFVFQFIIIIPLFFHESPFNTIGQYSKFYTYFIFILFFIILLISFIVSLISGIKKKYTPLFYSFLCFITLIVVIVIFELYLMIYWKNTEAFKSYESIGHKKSIIFGFEAKPNNTWNAFNATYNTDKFGFRINTLYPNWKNLKRKKIFVLGGSSVFGYGLNDNETWPHLLQLKNEIISNGPIFVNAGNNGFNSLQCILKFLLRIVEHKPSHIIFYESMNDFYYNKVKSDNVHIDENILFSSSVIHYWNKQSKNFNFYMRRLVFYYLLEKIPLLKKFKPTSQKFHEKKLYLKNGVFDWKTFNEICTSNMKIYIRNVIGLIYLCKAFNVEPILVTFIHDFLPSNEPAIAIKRQNELLRSLANLRKIKIIDLEKIFIPIKNKNEYFFKDHYHPSKKGAEFISTNIKKFLEKNL